MRVLTVHTALYMQYIQVYFTVERRYGLAALTTTTEEADRENEPNTALLSFILTICTFAIAYFLRHFRNSKFLGRTVSRVTSH